MNDSTWNKVRESVLAALIIIAAVGAWSANATNLRLEDRLESIDKNLTKLGDNVYNSNLKTNELELRIRILEREVNRRAN